jgi:dihydrodipicolinate synthase/N-acetylneuraminate lyase
VLLGSTGEFLHFSLEERSKLIGLAVRRSRVPVIVNVSHSTLDGTIQLARDANDAGVAAVLVMPPYFFRYRQDEVRDFFLRFAEQAQLRVPALLYNIPIFANELHVETAAELLASGHYAGMKDSGGDWDYFERVRQFRQSSGIAFTLMMGNDGLISKAYAGGLSGAISGIACAVPELLVALNQALEKNTSELITRYETRLNEFINRISRFPIPIGIREAAAMRGIKSGPHAIEIDATLCAHFRQWFKEWLPVVQKECTHA